MIAPIQLYAQAPLRVEVHEALNDAPVAHAVVRAAGQAQPTYTDQLGVARLAALPRPVALTIAAIGFRPDTVTVALGTRTLRVRLARPLVTLRDLTVTTANLDLAPAAAGAWVLPREALTRIPSAIEADPIRALAAVPSVSFSSLLSARPTVRGYDAADGTVRLNGFELVNPYHIGRVFSTLPVSALSNVTVAPHATAAADGGAIGAVIDLEGRAAASGTGYEGDAELGVASLSGSIAHTRPDVFVASRVGYLAGITQLIGDGVPYDFVDAYARARVPVARRIADVTAFATHDNFGDAGRGSGMEWSNILLGSRMRLLDQTTAAVDLSASLNQFLLDGRDIESAGSRLDLSNDLRRASVTLDASVLHGATRLAGGLSIVRRSLDTRVAGTADSAATLSSTARLTEFGPWAEVGLDLPGAVLSAGLRLDATGSATAWQPRARISFRPAAGIAVSVSATRAARLYQEVTDPMPEPTLTFYDLWLAAGRDGIPIPRVDHLALAADGRMGRTELHAGAFLSRGEGLGEALPEWEQTGSASQMRFGDARTRGLELRVARRASSGTSGWAASYVLSASDRRWTDEWVPWRLDRRHQLRAMADTRFGIRWMVFALGEISSGIPLTPVAEVIWPDGTVLGVSGTGGPPRDHYAPEGSARGSTTGHLDLGARFTFQGPWSSDASLSFSITNVTFGPTAPLVPVDPGELFLAPGSPQSRIRYKRAFDVPAVPSVTLSVAF
jgi:hypothetical protein